MELDKKLMKESMIFTGIFMFWFVIGYLTGKLS